MKRKVFSLLATLIFVSSSFSTVSLELFDESPSCFTYADTWATRIGFWNNLSHADEFRVFEILYDDCVASQN